ncbi:hypothetical protein CYJ25_00405 [Schaalia turicensis]|uniref:MULE transposase domain-containing protein n=1 Tax=Schaalia turicensis TaxID=131111 RepID=A0A2I1I6J4_9ACTO|nr:hypothetical protein CYJ25_00405 [Schaalia turicensis]
MTAKAEARLFRRWLLEEFSARQLGVAKTSFTNKTHWCWHVEVPKPQVTGEVYDQVLLDGIYLAYGWCLITATEGRKIIDWQWCQRENSATYQALMNRLPAPTVVLTDGGAGIAKALRLTWPQSRIQRCLFHIRANTITDLTHNPQSPAGKTLLGLANQLMGVKPPKTPESGLACYNTGIGYIAITLTRKPTLPSQGQGNGGGHTSGSEKPINVLNA